MLAVLGIIFTAVFQINLTSSLHLFSFHTCVTAKAIAKMSPLDSKSIRNHLYSLPQAIISSLFLQGPGFFSFCKSKFPLTVSQDIWLYQVSYLERIRDGSRKVLQSTANHVKDNQKLDRTFSSPTYINLLVILWEEALGSQFGACG